VVARRVTKLVGRTEPKLGRRQRGLNSPEPEVEPPIQAR
jgi:hypothetical protein